jgi:hypothetical protein
MALTIYQQVNDTSGFSTDGSFGNAMRHAIDGRGGGAVEQLYYLRNDDATKTYSSISIIPVSNPAKDIVSGPNGYSIKLFVGSTQPTTRQWENTTPANIITLADLSDTTTYLPFWVRIDVPRGAPVDTITSTFFRITATEGVVE